MFIIVNLGKNNQGVKWPWEMTYSIIFQISFYFLIVSTLLWEIWISTLQETKIIFPNIFLLCLDVKSCFSELLYMICFLLLSTSLYTRLNKLCARWQVCMQHACKEVFMCTKLRACKSRKTTLSSTLMLFKILSSFLCLEASNIQHNKIWHS